MPNYRTHITVSSGLGIALGGIAWFYGGIDLITSTFGGCLCAIGGLVPDIDSKTSQSFRKCLAIISGFSSLLLVSRLRDFPLDPQSVAIIGGGFFVLIWFVVGKIIQKSTVHRGMCHSIPMAILASEIIFMLSSGTMNERLFSTASMFFGVLIHLILDEYYSIEVKSATQGGIHIKKSFGSAIKMINFESWSSTISFFIILTIVTYLTFREPTWSEEIHERITEQEAQETMGRKALEKIQHWNPNLYDLSVVQWAAKNNFTLTPDNPENPKWLEIQALLMGKSPDSVQNNPDDTETDEAPFGSPQEKTSSNADDDNAPPPGAYRFTHLGEQKKKEEEQGKEIINHILRQEE